MIVGGRAKKRLAALLLNAGADMNARDETGLTPTELLKTDCGTTNFIASTIGVQLDEEPCWPGERWAVLRSLRTQRYAIPAAQNVHDISDLTACIRC